MLEHILQILKPVIMYLPLGQMRGFTNNKQA